MRKLLYIIVSTVILAACVGNGKERAMLDRAQAIINDCPDSALVILDSLESTSQDFSLESLRRWQLLRLMAQNKCYKPFHDDSLQQELVKYFDRNGTSNERMIAHSLLGRALSDMGETPEAIRCCQDAVACADTTSVDCDWWNLSRICLQLADECYVSYMPMEMKEALIVSHSSADHANDTITSIIAYSRLSEVYELLEMKDSAAIVIREAARLFKNHGRDDWASQTLSLLIEDEVEKGNLEEAKRIVDYYEGNSGLFNDDHEIEEGREIYYYSKGIYYLGCGQKDSAECAFRKLLNLSQNVNDVHAAYLGLRKKYFMTGPKDSLVKYAMLSESSNDSLYLEHYKANVQLLQKRYNYSRHVENEQKLFMSVERKNKHFLTLVFIFVLAAVASMAFYQNKRRKREKLGIEYTNLMSKYRQACHETEQLKSDKGVALREKENENVQLKSQLDGMKNLFDGLSLDMKKLALSKSDIVKKFREMAIPQAPPILPCQKDWKLLMETMEYTNPSLYRKIILSDNLSQQEIYTCLLTMLHFSNGEITVLLGTSKQRVSNMKASANYKLFDSKDAKALLKNLETL